MDEGHGKRGEAKRQGRGKHPGKQKPPALPLVVAAYAFAVQPDNAKVIASVAAETDDDYFRPVLRV